MVCVRRDGNVPLLNGYETCAPSGQGRRTEIRERSEVSVVTGSRRDWQTRGSYPYPVPAPRFRQSTRPHRGLLSRDSMTTRPPADLQAENAYLRLRIAQLEGDVADLSAQLLRGMQQADRLLNQRASIAPNPLAGGQSS